MYHPSELQISKALADSIVSEIGITVNKNINIMDASGIIIASSDAARVGQRHEVALQIIEHNLNEVYIDPKDDQTLMKAGLNMPIIVSGRRIGVLGITGPYEEVNILGPVLKKATEIFVATEIKKSDQIQDVRVKENIIRRWLFMEKPVSKDSLLFQQLELLNIKAWQHYRIASLIYNDRALIEQTQDGFSRLEAADQLILNDFRFNRDTVIIKENNERIIFFFNQQQERILNRIETVRQQLKNRLQLQFTIGLDSRYETDRPLDAHQQAVFARKTAEKKQIGCILYDDLDIDVLLNYIPRDIKMDFVKKIFKIQQTDAPALADYVRLLKTHFAYNGSIHQMAEALYLHPNTIQYRLKKIAEVTGLDPRKLQPAALLYLAVSLYEELTPDPQPAKPRR